MTDDKEQLPEQNESATISELPEHDAAPEQADNVRGGANLPTEKQREIAKST